MKLRELLDRLGPFRYPEPNGFLPFDGAQSRLTEYLKTHEDQLGNVLNQDYKGYYSNMIGTPFHAWVLGMSKKEKQILYGAWVTPGEVHVEVFTSDGFGQMIALSKKI